MLVTSHALRALLVLLVSGGPILVTRPSSAQELSEAEAGRFAALALECVHKEFPNQISHRMEGPEDVGRPRELTPAFYGCFDWHSAVHGHWLLARLARRYPTADFAAEAREALGKSLTKEHLDGEVAYLGEEHRVSFERPYGLAWLLQLAAELREWRDDPEAKRWSLALEPLEALAAKRIAEWLPKLSHPVRIGEHAQTAFSLGLVHDWAKLVSDDEMLGLSRERVTAYYLDDRECPLDYEPSGEDFLSPCLAEADLVRRFLDGERFAAWLEAFLPQIPKDGSTHWLEAAVVSDPNDPKIGHLYGLNLSRAWMLRGIASALPEGDPRILSLERTAELHRAQGLAGITSDNYVGGHWLGTFAAYLATR